MIRDHFLPPQTHISRDSPVGTIKYMAPETIYQGEEVLLTEPGTLKLHFGADVWSLGIICRGEFEQVLFRCRS